MAKYTFELRELCEPLVFNPPIMSREQVEDIFKDYELSDYLTEEQIRVIENADIWNKDRLAKQVVDHYYVRESGFETIGLFIHYAKVEMQELMEEYLPLIYSASIEYDPLVNVDFTETFTRDTKNTGSSTSNSKNNGSSLAVNSDTPQGQISKNEILQGKYATSTGATESESNINDNTSSSSNGLENYTKRVKGNSGVSATAQKMVEQYRNNIRAINREIIKKLNILFMGLY